MSKLRSLIKLLRKNMKNENNKNMRLHKSIDQNSNSLFKCPAVFNISSHLQGVFGMFFSAWITCVACIEGPVELKVLGVNICFLLGELSCHVNLLNQSFIAT